MVSNVLVCRGDKEQGDYVPEHSPPGSFFYAFRLCVQDWGRTSPE